MNSVYLFHVDDKDYYIAAENWKEARNILVRMPEYKDFPLTDITGRRMNSKCTELSGILSSEYVLEHLAWWTCKCGGNSFIPLDDGSVCRCKRCGREKRNFILCP